MDTNTSKLQLIAALALVSLMVPSVSADEPREIENMRKMLENAQRNARGSNSRMFYGDDSVRSVPVDQSADDSYGTGGSWSTWRKGDFLGLDKNLPVSGTSDIDRFIVPLALSRSNGSFIKRRARTVY